ncbi:MAG: hypothetical protein E6997_00365 [Citrobacter sp.]|jgi:hypothetical protein|uniref:hypothetical protein n=1 Tax=Enterobacterales TaxID=91347 RepID=UPI0005422B8E|nr:MULTISPECIES: hypothetical protein [Citrobacter]MDU1181450.1 hypothetical protein [Citrobacter sp.]EIV2909517.1 hypothetical protein [Citrobacter braakii]EIV2910594.1 hypothetical protein [Citrobacter braakii]KHE11955.1 hypothetical protein LH87_19415 [Citrobacter braakii]MBJ8818766.1 hypothetical protein [Citrobacter braakii]
MLLLKKYIISCDDTAGWVLKLGYIVIVAQKERFRGLVGMGYEHFNFNNFIGNVFYIGKVLDMG